MLCALVQRIHNSVSEFFHSVNIEGQRVKFTSSDRFNKRDHHHVQQHPTTHPDIVTGLLHPQIDASSISTEYKPV